MQQAQSTTAPIRTGTLEGVRVVDLSRHRVGAMASLMLAELGAEVVKLRLRQDGDSGMSATQAAIWDRSKSVQALDLDLAEDRSRLCGWVDQASVVLQDRTPAEMKRLALDEDTLCAGRTDLIFACIGGWPMTHALAERPVDDALVLAEAGVFDEQLGIGRAGPVYLAFPLGTNVASYLAAIGVVVRLLVRQNTQRGGRVATSLLQGAMLPMMMYWERSQTPTPSVKNRMAKQTPQTLYECGDGAWMHVMGDASKAAAVRAALDDMGPEQVRLANERCYGNGPRALPNIGALSEVFRRKPRAEWLSLLWQADVPVQPVTETGPLLHDEQAHASGYVASVETVEFGLTLQATVPVHLSPPVQIKANPLLPQWAPVAAPPAAGHRRLPLEGTKVLDFGAYLAGPLAAMLLADLGADVIKVEPLGGEPMRQVEWAFNACQRGKRVLSLDLAHPAAKEVLARLVRSADIVHHNQRMQTAGKLGIDAEALKRLNADLIYAHVSAYGPVGPRKDWPGYDQLFQALSGWEMEAAGQGNRPTWLRFGMMDHLAALASLLGCVAALYQRSETGQGQTVAASLLGASLFTLDTAELESGALLPYPKLDQAQMGFTPTQRMYCCADGWVAVSAPQSDAWQRIAALSDCADVAALERHLKTSQVLDTLALFAQAEVPAVQVALAQEAAFFDDPRHRAAHLVAEFTHPVYGAMEQLGALWDFGDLALALDKAPPAQAQHTRDILLGLGYSAEAIDALAAQGVVRTA